MARLRSMTPVAAVVAGLAFSSVAAGGAATAATSKWEAMHFEGGPDTFSNFCGVTGLTVINRYVVDGRSRTTNHGPDGLPYYVEVARHYVTWTNAATDEYVTVVAHSRDAYQKVTDNGDGTFSVIVAAQRNEMLFNEDGKQIGHIAGLVTFPILVDNGGTPTDPADDQVVDDDLGVLKEVGKPDNFCTATVQAIG